MNEAFNNGINATINILSYLAGILVPVLIGGAILGIVCLITWLLFDQPWKYRDYRDY